MNRISTHHLMTAALATAVTGFFAGTALAVPYASGVKQVGNTVTYVLNEEADTVTITRDGGSALVSNNVARGVYTFDMTGFADFEIQVDHSAPVGWASVANGFQNQISSESNQFLDIERPSGLEVNKNPGSEHFGNIYIVSSTEFGTVNGRTMGDGIYVLNAAGDESNGVTDPNDTSAARTAGFDFTGTSTSPWKLSIGEDDTVYATDWSDAKGGIRYFDPTITTGGLVLATEGGPVDGNPDGVHGSIMSVASVTGSLAGGDLVVWAMDEDLANNHLDVVNSGAVSNNNGNHIWKWNVGGTEASTVLPELVIDLTTIGPNGDNTFSDGAGPVMFTDIRGVWADFWRDPETGNFYMTQPRNDGNEAGLLIFDADGNELFNSREWTLANGLDGFVDDIDSAPTLGVQDVFRFIHTARTSPDGEFIALHARTNPFDAQNPLTDQPGDDGELGTDDDTGEAVYIFPLLENGLPDLTLDLTGDKPLFANMQTVAAHDSGSSNSRSEVIWDLAGNLYVTMNIDEKVRIFGPGGDSEAITSSDGTFTINGVTYGGGDEPGIPGDANGDGKVDLLDLSILASNFDGTDTPYDVSDGDFNGDGFVNLLDLSILASNFETSPAPEPAAAGLLGLGAMALLRRR
ncbi:dockerin type I domain-containing protein [Mucisphaera calidilacus]|uniref:Dockerin domain-containing protein n=1 Tax=Mucisphaera calidilacus TaxID=2527982 RepID=A0A518BWF8_9BACT|nr:dockerin type I domain-containing protein [Mucisphaera calidilacus]QDU71316.1 hypothetical protein Pan265_11650 [Mucisphaera calidilacus]